MFLLVVSLLLICLGAAVAGAVVTGMFWLTLVGLAGVLVVGAAAVSTSLPRDGELTTGPERRTELRLVTSAPESPRRLDGQDGGEPRRAA